MCSQMAAISVIQIRNTLRWNPKRILPLFCKKKKKNFLRKLSYDQINNDILDNYSILSVHCLLSPTFRTYTQERDKEQAHVQKAMLNVSAPLCWFHGALSSNKDVHKEDIQTILEQSICSLGSVNFYFSALRRMKILVAINKDKIGLADQSLPNAKRMLFGDDSLNRFKSSRPI